MNISSASKPSLTMPFLAAVQQSNRRFWIHAVPPRRCVLGLVERRVTPKCDLELPSNPKTSGQRHGKEET